MTRPHIICHMASSLDGRILSSRWRPLGARSHDQYEALHRELGGGSWLVGRVTGEEFAKGEAYPAVTDRALPRESWIRSADETAYAVVLDTHGKIAWRRADIDGDPIVVLLLETVSDAHLAGLREDGVSYIFIGAEAPDLSLGMSLLRERLGIEHLLLEGGGHLNGSMLRAGLVDEVSLILTPVIDGRAGAPAVFDGREDDRIDAVPSRLERIEARPLADDAVWVRYRVTYDDQR